ATVIKQLLQGPEESSVAQSAMQSPVRVYTEWDPLEEVIVGIIDDVRVPEWDASLAAVIPARSRAFFQKNSGGRFPEEQVMAAKRELDTLACILSDEGIVVRRPVEMNHHRPVITPFFQTGGGFYSA